MFKISLCDCALSCCSLYGVTLSVMCVSCISAAWCMKQNTKLAPMENQTFCHGECGIDVDRPRSIFFQAENLLPQECSDSCGGCLDRHLCVWMCRDAAGAARGERQECLHSMEGMGNAGNGTVGIYCINGTFLPFSSYINPC